MAQTRDLGFVYWAIADHENVIYLKTIRMKRTDTLKDFLSQMEEQLGEKKNWYFYQKKGFKLIGVQVDIAESFK
jgi:hypothetical protein